MGKWGHALFADFQMHARYVIWATEQHVVLLDF